MGVRVLSKRDMIVYARISGGVTPRSRTRHLAYDIICSVVCYYHRVLAGNYPVSWVTVVWDKGIKESFLLIGYEPTERVREPPDKLRDVPFRQDTGAAW